MTRPRIRHNRFGDTRDTGAWTQQAAIQINAGQTLTGAAIRGNDLRNNNTQAISNAGAFSACNIDTNIGYNPQAIDSLGASASPLTYTSGPAQEVIYILNCTVFSITVSGTTMALAAPATTTLPRSTDMVTTYSAAPTAVKRQRL